MSDNTTPANPLSAMTDAWVQMTQTAIESATAVNRAALGTYQDSNGDDRPNDAVSDGGAKAESAPGTEPSELPSLAFEDAEWSFDRSAEDATALAVGDSVTFTKRITAEDVERFAAVSGDTNRLHLDDEFAEDSRFGGRIAHGTLVSGLISAALARLPGLTIYLSQDLEFRGPVELDDRVSAVVEIVEDLGDGQFRLATTIENAESGTTVIDGEAVVLIDELPV
ncbi:MaoC family dehydratase [Natronoarchaeum mannanilyticum]|uniref:MaoC-like domain-containing protein n=1 Tax=Natronoarchaeum mannanilyticum TaxID=926360 RepID=A0AAV3TBV4_9EURY